LVTVAGGPKGTRENSGAVRLLPTVTVFASELAGSDPIAVAVKNASIKSLHLSLIVGAILSA